MRRGQDLDLRRRYRRPDALVGRPERRRRRSRRRGLAALVVMVMALLVVTLIANIQRAHQLDHEPAGRRVAAHP